MEKVIRNKKILLYRKSSQNMVQKSDQDIRRNDAATHTPESIYKRYHSSETGMHPDAIENARTTFGVNTVTHGKKEPLVKKIVKAFVNPFTAILFALACISFIMDVQMAAPGQADPVTVIIIMSMVLISGALRFFQERRSTNAAKKLLNLIKTTTCVERQEKGTFEIPLSQVVTGDIVHLCAGDMIPADMRIIAAKDLFVSQSAMTGESEPVEKLSESINTDHYHSFTDYPNMAYLGCNVISGTAKGIVIATGNDTIFADMAKSINEKPVQTSFEKGVNSVTWVLIRFMLVMVPVVFFINGFTKGNWIEALLFAISIAVGLTPEMLPMIVTTCLAKGAVAMSKEKTIIKNLNAIQNLGSMDLLCTDKTGTLTQDKVVLAYHLNIEGKEDVRVLRHAFLNSYYQTGLKNLMDHAIIDKALQHQQYCLTHLSDGYEKIDEIPFDFNRRRMSVVVEDMAGKTQMITKGAVEEMLRVCGHVEYQGKVHPLTSALKAYIQSKVDALNDDGMRVLAIAHKTNPSPVGAFGVQDENDMVLIGYLAFLDPPKESAAAAIGALKENGVGVKILTGDNDKVTRTVCRQVGIGTNKILLGSDLEHMSEQERAKAVEEVHIFAKLSPEQKATVLRILRDNGHTVGYMGDGINDAAAMRASDVGISVDTAVDIAKESADVILLEKDLMVLEKGILEGRKTYGNMIKYIKMTASSNFGNMFSVLIASAFLPFMPMMSLHLILLNLIYDLSCLAIPWDNMDAEYLKIPRKWDASSVGNFMVWIGPASSVFDITTYLLMYFIICPLMCGGMLYHQISDPVTRLYFIALFQTGWFVESMWSQTLVIHMIRTPKVPFIQSRASLPLTLLTFTGIAVLTLIPFSAFGQNIHLAPLPMLYFAVLVLTILLYMILATVLKKAYINKYGQLL